MDLKILEGKITESLRHLDFLFRQKCQFEEENLEHENEEYDNTIEAFRDTANSIYLQICAYIEFNGLHEYLVMFKEAFKGKLTTNEIFNSWFHEESAEQYSVLYSDFWTYLPFNFVKTQDLAASEFHSLATSMLEKVLKNTDRIMKIQKATFKNETDIYKTVRPVIEILFPSVMKTSGHAILNKLKNYKPDIFIPEMQLMVEYKLINSDDDIVKCISEIADDVVGYKDKIGTNLYKHFYVVFYITKSSLTEDRFNELWKEREYPENWKPISVFERT